MKITLVQCPAWTSESPPYALALLAAVLKKNGHEVTCFDFNIEVFRYCREQAKQNNSIIDNESWQMDFRGQVWYEKDNVTGFINKNEIYINKLIELVANAPSQIIGFSVQSTSKFFSLEVARRIKERSRNKIIVFGGPLCFRNCYGVDILNDFRFLDFVCLGEGERSFLRLINIIEKNGYIESFPGFGYRLEDGNIKDGGDDSLLKNLDDLPFAEYSPFNLEKYTKKLLPISTSRGCINKCSFCSESTHWQKYRMRSARNIFQEIKYQLDRNPEIEMFWFNDSLINGDIRMLNELCDLLISNRIKIKWGGQGMIRREMNKDFLQKMKLAGCEVISYGVENGSGKILRLMKKFYTPELSKKVIRDTYEVGINVIFNIIIGFPGETEVEFQETKDFVECCKQYAAHIELVTLLLLKGSYIYDHLDEFDISPIDYNDQLKWKTNDNKNTYDIRKKRLEELKELIAQKIF